MGWWWPAVALGALSVAVHAWDLLKEVTINPTIELPELTQDWGSRLWEGTDGTLSTQGPRRKEQSPYKRLTKTWP